VIGLPDRGAARQNYDGDPRLAAFATVVISHERAFQSRRR
jgi:hypothetical protein